MPVALCLPPQVILTIALGAILVLSPFQRWQSGAGGGLLQSSDAEILGYAPLQGRGCRGSFLQRPLPFLAGFLEQESVWLQPPAAEGGGTTRAPGH